MCSFLFLPYKQKTRELGEDRLAQTARAASSTTGPVPSLTTTALLSFYSTEVERRFPELLYWRVPRFLRDITVKAPPPIRVGLELAQKSQHPRALWGLRVHGEPFFTLFHGLSCQTGA